MYPHLEKQKNNKRRKSIRIKKKRKNKLTQTNKLRNEIYVLKDAKNICGKQKGSHDPVTQTQWRPLQKIHDRPFRLTSTRIVTSVTSVTSRERPWRGGSKCIYWQSVGREIFVSIVVGRKLGVTEHQKTNWRPDGERRKGGDLRRKARAIKEAPVPTMGIKHLNMKVRGNIGVREPLDFYAVPFIIRISLHLYFKEFTRYFRYRCSRLRFFWRS